MKKNLLLYILLAFLIVVNGFFLFNYLGRPGAKGPKGPDDFIVKQLKFDQSQMDQFKTISNAHRKKMNTISDDIKKQKDVLFSKISKDSLNKQEIDSVTTIIGMKQYLLETEVFYNLRAIHELCNDEQKKRFNDIIKNARHGGSNPNQMPPPPSKND
ncbi:hypothetical protein [Aureibaculum luteum]|uniref:hypothetical protein n=1 Tax=Aureibaculum luteum TaxID=1548456 RepID=UPI000E48DD5E|nr:hypothetical protein [Aureibaculum luteum]